MMCAMWTNQLFRCLLWVFFMSVVRCADTTQDNASTPSAIQGNTGPSVAVTWPNSSRGTTGISEDEKRREDILNVVEHQLSSEKCKSVVLSQMIDISICLRDGCATLESFENVISAVGCTADDYTKLHTVICSPNDPPCTSKATQTTGISEDEKRRQDILNVVEHQLSSESCKNAVLLQMSDRSQCLRDGCKTLESYETLITLVGCTTEDYTQLHNVICSENDPPCTSAAPQTTGISEDEKRREDILNVVEHQLSSESCKNAVLLQMSDRSQCLRDGCKTLESYETLITLVGCTTEDYTKLHNVICSENDPPCTSAAPQTTGMSEDDKRRADILHVVENELSTNSCRDAALTQMSDRTQCLRDGCAKLEGLKGFISVVGCTTDDYDKLHDVICHATDPPCSTASPDTTTAGGSLSREQVQRQQIRCTIRNRLSSEECEKVVGSKTSEDDTIEHGCQTLESFKTLVAAVGCTQTDYNILHDVICTWDGSETCIDYYQMQQDMLQKTEQGLRPSCNTSISNQIKDTEMPVYCANLKKEEDHLSSSNACNSTEIANLKKAVCCSGAACFDPNLNPNTRTGRILIALNYASPACSRTLAVARKGLLQTSDLACSFLESTKPALLGGNVCTEKDYSDLQAVVCQPEDVVTPPDPFANEKEQRDRIKDVILNGVGPNCSDFMTQVAGEQVSDPLEKTCKSFLDNYGFIVIGGQCTGNEYDKLKAVICGTSSSVLANYTLLITSTMLVLIKIISETGIL